MDREQVRPVIMISGMTVKSHVADFDEYLVVLNEQEEAQEDLSPSRWTICEQMNKSVKDSRVARDLWGIFIEVQHLFEANDHRGSVNRRPDGAVTT